MIRTVTVPGQTLERGNGRTQVAASIKERNCNRQINKIGCDNVMAYLSSFYGTVKLRGPALTVRAARRDARIKILEERLTQLTRPRELLTEKEAAAILRVHPDTLKGRRKE